MSIGDVKIELVGQAAALELLWRKSVKQPHVGPIFIPSSGRAGIANLNFDLPHALRGYQHVVVIIVDKEEVGRSFVISFLGVACCFALSSAIANASAFLTP